MSYRDSMHLPPRSEAVGAQFIACCIARSFRNRESIDRRELMDKFGMSKATACRWAKAWREANGHAA